MVSVREMTIEDLGQVMEIENSCFSVPWTENGFFTFLIRDDTLFLVAEEEGKIFGYCGLILIPDEGEITNVAVSEVARGKGIGKKLLSELLDRSAGKGINHIYLEVRRSNDPAITLYANAGFQKEGYRLNYYQEPKEDALIMSYHRQKQ